MRALLYFNPVKAHQVRFVGAFGDGLKEWGVKVSTWQENPTTADFIVTWGDRRPPGCDLPALMLENGYINGDHGAYEARRAAHISTSWGAMHGLADASPDRPADRWDALAIELAPWCERDGPVLVCRQLQNDQASPSAAQWRDLMRDVTFSFARFVVRPHPRDAPNQQTLTAALANASACVTWSSTAAVEAVIAGVPTVVYSIGSIAWPVTSHLCRERRFVGDRLQWAYNLAYRQWTYDEIRRGECWQHIAPQ